MTIIHGLKTGRHKNTIFKLRYGDKTYYGTALATIVRHLESNVVNKRLLYREVVDACGARMSRVTNKYKGILCEKIVEPTPDDMKFVDDSCVLITRESWRLKK